MKRRLSWVGMVLAVLESGCVHGTAYQRAVALQQPHPSSDDVAQGLADSNWKVRTLAAQACARTEDSSCVQPIERLVSTDLVDEVRVGALESLASRCTAGGREALARLVRDSAVRTAHPSEQALFHSIGTCPSGDAVLTLTLSKDTEATNTLGTLQLGAVPAAARARRDYFSQLLKLPAPRSVVEMQLAVAQSEVHALELVEAADTQHQREEEQRKSQAKVAQESEAGRHIELALAALGHGNLATAEGQIQEAKSLGADVTAAQNRFAEVKQSLGQAHVTQGWSFLRKKKTEEARSEYQQAVALGTPDARLGDAVERAEDELSLVTWKKYARSCVRLQRDKSTADGVRQCNDACLRVQAKVQAAWDELESNPYPTPPQASSSAAKVHELCNRSGCPNCP